jgi:hypothetical protein
MALNTALGVANFLARDQFEVNAYKDVEVNKIAEDLALADSEALLIANLGTVPTVPAAGTIGVVTVVSPTSVSVAWTPGSDGGAAITSVGILTNPAVPGGASWDADDVVSPILVTGDFVEAQGYQFKVFLSNEVGTSVGTANSTAVVPNP